MNVLPSDIRRFPAGILNFRMAVTPFSSFNRCLFRVCILPPTFASKPAFFLSFLVFSCLHRQLTGIRYEASKEYNLVLSLHLPVTLYIFLCLHFWELFLFGMLNYNNLCVFEWTSFAFCHGSWRTHHVFRDCLSPVVINCSLLKLQIPFYWIIWYKNGSFAMILLFIIIVRIVITILFFSSFFVA